MIDQYFAQTLPNKPPADWQPVEQHLKETAEKVNEFANAFAAGDWGYLRDFGMIYNCIVETYAPFSE
jgi:hypothetical protein